MDVLPILQAGLSSLLQYRYLALFLAASVEGFNTLLVAGFLISTGVFEVIPAFTAAFLAEFTSGYFWYGVGYWGGAKPLEFFVGKSTQQKKFFERIKSSIQEYTGPILLVAKLTWSLTIATLIMTGSFKYPLKKFSFYNFIGSVGWVFITFSIGYFLGTGYQFYIEYFKNISYLVVLVTLTIVLIHLLSRASQGILLKAFSVLDRIRDIGGKVYEEFEKNTRKR